MPEAAGYARHVVKVMGCKSPVSMSKITIKSLVKHKGEVVRLSSESSVDQRHEPMHKNGIGGVCSRMSGPRIAKSDLDELHA